MAGTVADDACASHLGYLRFLGLTDSLTVVLGFRFAVDFVTNRPVFAERCRFPDPLPLRPLAIVIFLPWYLR